MKSVSNISLLLVHVVLFTIYCSSVVRCDDNLIQQTCKQTPNPALCVSTLKSDPQSSKAVDVKGLALITINVVKVKATETAKIIGQQLKSKPELKQALTNCASQYDTILTATIPSATQAVELGDPKFGEDGMKGTAEAAQECEDGFGGKSTITSANQFVHDISTIGAAMIRLLE
ncbi:hypothetical protein Tsubulata_031767 [Turnera subulata]|uniref:Pectinesterase inhibitor domain-containing protein n=1 Tax=Turnera subulata TaxID=218843 RepID=A0A9Q0EYK8_9ROSI|nr:hypothetical protein Tsubulata_031767 [Turnera subulata]